MNRTFPTTHRFNWRSRGDQTLGIAKDFHRGVEQSISYARRPRANAHNIRGAAIGHAAIHAALTARPVDISPFVFCTRTGASYINAKTGSANGWDRLWQRFMARVLTEANVAERFTEHHLRDLIIGKFACELTYPMDDLARVSYLIGHKGWEGNLDICTGTTLPADIHGDIFDKQSHHALAIVGRGGRCIPQTRKVLREREHLRLLLGGYRSGLPTLRLGILLLDLIEPLQTVIPPTPQSGGR